MFYFYYMVIIVTLILNSRSGFFISLTYKCLIMVYERKNPISKNDQEVLTAIGRKIFKLRKATGLSLERFCSRNDIPRISYSNIEAGKNFHMTTLLKVLACYKSVKSLSDFFRDI